MNTINDTTQHVSIETDCNHTIHMWRIQDGSVVVVAVDNTVPKESYIQHLKDALELIEEGNLFYFCFVMLKLCDVPISHIKDRQKCHAFKLINVIIYLYI